MTFPRLLLAATLAALVLLPAAPAGASGAGNLRHFGYFAARLTPSSGNHLAEVAKRSNLNWVQISDVDRYRPEVLDGCRPAGCIVSTGNEFFAGCDSAGSADCHLYPDFRARWLRLAAAVHSRIGRVGAFYLLDEPQFRGASPADLALAAQTIKTTFPKIPVMMVEAGPEVTGDLRVPGNIDWVGFDWYCRPFSDIEAKLGILEQRTTAAQKLFLMPEAAPLAECGGRPGHATDAEIAQLQWRYFDLAVAHPRVIGLLAFGFWTSGHDSHDLPLTVAAHQQIAARVIPPPVAAPTPAPTPPPTGVASRVRFMQGHVRLGRWGRMAPAVRCPAAATAPCTGRLAARIRTGRRVRPAARRRLPRLAPGTTRHVRLRVRPGVRRTLVRRARRHRGARLRLIARTPAGVTRRMVVVRAR